MKDYYEGEEVSEGKLCKFGYIRDIRELFKIIVEEGGEEREEKFLGGLDLNIEEYIKIAESGELKKNGKTFRRSKFTRRDLLPEKWFDVIDLMKKYLDQHHVSEENLRLFIWID